MASKTTIVSELHVAKRNSGKTYGQIADETGLTNVYVAQLLRRQAQLKPDTAPLLRAVLPDLTENHIREMMQPPMRSYDPNLLQEPAVYRLNEAIMHFGESIKEIINEDFGDGIMSAIDFYCSVDKIKGVDGKDRVVVTFDGKYLPYTEQSTAHMVSRLRKQDNQLNEDCTSAQTTNPVNAPNFQCPPNVQGPPNFQYPKSQCPPHLQAPPNIHAILNPHIPVCYNPFMGTGNPTTPIESQFPTQQQLKNIVITNEASNQADEKRVKSSIEEDKMLANAWLVIHLKGILNKLTPQNFEKSFEQVKQVNIDNVVTLSCVVSHIFDKALMEPTFCEMYANLCFHLAADLPELSVENERITFRRLLLNKCQEEFERGEREEEEANKAEEEGGDCKQTPEEREEKRLEVRKRMLGNIRLIGELYKKRMLTERVMHECINKLLGQQQNPDEENIEALCKLMSTIGVMIDHANAKKHMDAYFDIMARLSNNMKLSSQVRFMLKDCIDLRKNKWQRSRKVERPKKIDEVHRDASQERQAQASRLARGPSYGGSARRGGAGAPPPMEYAPRAQNIVSSPNFRPRLRNYGSQDVRIDSVSLQHRSFGDESIHLEPQGGVGRGMSFREHTNVGPSLNGVGLEQTGYGQREDLAPRYMPERFVAPSGYEQSRVQERNAGYEYQEVKINDRSVPDSPRGGRVEGQTGTQNVSSENIWSEEQLQEKSSSAIKEFYSARDQAEVVRCMKELNTPGFYPSMISIWVIDSFERKDMERDLLTSLIIKLTQDNAISNRQLAKGFELALEGLEEAVNDAPKAAEFFGRMLAKVILEKIAALSEIGQLLYEGGEEKGRLVEIGLAAEVLATILDIIKLEKGDTVLDEILSNSNLRLENFRPPNSKKASRLHKFI